MQSFDLLLFLILRAAFLPPSLNLTFILLISHRSTPESSRVNAHSSSSSDEEQDSRKEPYIDHLLPSTTTAVSRHIPTRNLPSPKTHSQDPPLSQAPPPLTAPRDTPPRATPPPSSFSQTPPLPPPRPDSNEPKDTSTSLQITPSYRQATPTSDYNYMIPEKISTDDEKVCCLGVYISIDINKPISQYISSPTIYNIY